MYPNYTLVQVALNTAFEYRQLMDQWLGLLMKVVGPIGYFQMVKQIFIHLHPVAVNLMKADGLVGATVVALHSMLFINFSKLGITE